MKRLPTVLLVLVFFQSFILSCTSKKKARNKGMDSKSIEYPCPFYNPRDGRYYMYYLVKSREGPYRPTPKQTGEQGPSLCHATAPLSDPSQVGKDPNNPVFSESIYPVDETLL